MFPWKCACPLYKHVFAHTLFPGVFERVYILLKPVYRAYTLGVAMVHARQEPGCLVTHLRTSTTTATLVTNTRIKRTKESSTQYINGTIFVLPVLEALKHIGIWKENLYYQRRIDSMSVIHRLRVKVSVPMHCIWVNLCCAWVTYKCLCYLMYTHVHKHTYQFEF